MIRLGRGGEAVHSSSDEPEQVFRGARRQQESMADVARRSPGYLLSASFDEMRTYLSSEDSSLAVTAYLPAIFTPFAQTVLFPATREQIPPCTLAYALDELMRGEFCRPQTRCASG